MTAQIRVLGPGDEATLERVAHDVFDGEPQPGVVRELLADPRHHLVVAVEDETVIGFVSGVHYMNPDKRQELWVNEISVAPPYRRRGVARALLHALLQVGARMGCNEAWVLTDRENVGAVRLYQAAGGTEAPRESVMFEFRLSHRAG